MDWRHALDTFEAAAKAAEAMTVENVIRYMVTAVQICEAWGVKPTTLHQIRIRNPKFPEPIAHFRPTDVFWGPEVDAFMATYRRSKPRKPKGE